MENAELAVIHKERIVELEQIIKDSSKILDNCLDTDNNAFYLSWKAESYAALADIYNYQGKKTKAFVYTLMSKHLLSVLNKKYYLKDF